MAPRFAATYEARPETVGVLRNQMAALAEDCGLGAREVGDVRLAVSEAATNALLHAYGKSGGTIRVEAQIAGDELVIQILDEGRGMKPRPDSPGLGLGLPVIASVANSLEISPRNGGTSLRMAFDCPKADAL